MAKSNKQILLDATDDLILDMKIKDDEWLSSGSLLMNLVASGRPDGCFAKGGMFWIVGDSQSGKTFLSMTCLAEATINPNFDNYDLIFDNAEGGALMDIETFFGKRLAKRLRPPAWSEGVPVYSEKIEDLYFFIDDFAKRGKPFIYVLDSMDALTSKPELDKFQEMKTANRENKKSTGTYGMDKPKINSQWMRQVIAKLRDTRSILIIISQTRDNVDREYWEPEKTASGGRATKFYATWQMWSSVGSSIKKTVNGNERETGVNVRIRFEKNRLSGKPWTVEIPIYFSSGFDDIGSQIDFLLSEKEITSDNGMIKIPKLDLSGRRETIIKKIEEKDQGGQLRDLVVSAWREIEEACFVKRRNRYSE